MHLNTIIKMKYLIYIFLFLSCTHCSPKLLVPTAEVNFIGKDNQGTINLRSIGYAEKWDNLEDAKTDAEENAFNSILFRGIPGTDVENAMIGLNEQEIKSKHSDYFKSFFVDKRYKTFLMSSNPITPITSKNGYKKITVDLKINIQSLRRDLEQNKVIRGFGF